MRRGTARGNLTARENMATAMMRSEQLRWEGGGVHVAEERRKDGKSENYSSPIDMLRNSSAPIGYSAFSAPIFGDRWHWVSLPVVPVCPGGPSSLDSAPANGRTVHYRRQS